MVVGDSETLAKVKEISNKNHPIMRRYPSQKENWQQWFSTKEMMVELGLELLLELVELEEMEEMEEMVLELEMMVELERFLGVASCSLEILFLIVSC